MPQIKEGNYSIYLDKLDSIFISTIHPTCFLCNEPFEVNETVINIRGTFSIRLDEDCFENLHSGMEIFGANIQEMNVFSTGIN